MNERINSSQCTEPTTNRRGNPVPLLLLFLFGMGIWLFPGCDRERSAVEPTSPELEPYRELVTKLIELALAEGQAYEKLVSLCEEAPARLAGTPEAERAVQWGRETMIRDGLSNVRIEPVVVPTWDRGEVERLTLVATGAGESSPEPFSILALGGSVGTPSEGITAPVVEVQDFEELKSLGGEAEGKIIFFNRPMDPTQIDTFSAYGGAVNQRSRGAVEAAKAGGVAAIVRSMTTVLDDSPHTGSMGYQEGVEKVPAAAISTVGAERLSQRLRDRGRVLLKLELDCRTLEDRPSHNVVGEIIGTEFPDEIIVVGGHLDSWDVGEGAHDDGSGCCHALEALRLIKKAGFRPRRTLRAVLFMNEENGVRGGRTYFEAHQDEMANHVFALESDRGGFTPRGFTTDANPQAFAILEQIGTLLRSIGGDQVLPGFGGVDISPMRQVGVPTMGFLPDSQRYFDFHHSAKDIATAVNERELELGAAAIASMIAIVADLPETLPRNPKP